ncbi:MAG: amino acid ABC transporter ATP-binding protein [Bacilli bacterium]|nr:amino acid ABC transporter ATP-binding protein [Bacilli bacterium]
MPSNNSIIKVENLAKSFDGATEVLKDISFEIFKGDVIAIIGPSGSGKSTLLRCINQLEMPTKGTISFHGKNINQLNLNNYRSHVGMVFQSFNLFNNKSVLDNCVLPQRTVLKRKKKEAITIAQQNLSLVGMSDRMYYKPENISGGQKQRVAIARALCMKPEVLLFDEPTSALDPEMTASVLDVMKKLANQGMTMAVVTHEMQFARAVANKLIFMDGGYILAADTPEKVFTACKDERVNNFLHQKYENKD